MVKAGCIIVLFVVNAKNDKLFVFTRTHLDNSHHVDVLMTLTLIRTRATAASLSKHILY